MIRSTLCYIEKDGKYLMLFRNKKFHDPCEGKWVGIGGKFEPGETQDECLLREVWEETGLKLTAFHFHGIVHFQSDRLEDEDMYLYTASSFDGNDPASGGSRFDCNEGDLCWIPKADVLSLNLWEGDPLFLRKLIAGEETLEMTCRYEGDRLVSWSDDLSPQEAGKDT